MVAPRFRSRTFLRAKKRTPSGKLITQYNRRNKGKPQCGSCGEYLKGVARGIVANVKKLSKTQRRPERPYGGVLCTKCMRNVMVEKAKSLGVKKNG